MTYQITLIDLGTKHLQELYIFLSERGTVQIVSHDVDFSLLTSNLIVLSGGSRLTFRSPHFYNLKQFIISSQIPIVGICLGAQIIASAYQSHFYKNLIKIQGIQQIRILETGETFDVYQAHRFCIDELGPELDGIAGSEMCYEIFKHKTKKILGLQFHPEVINSINQGAALLKSLLTWI